jgi:hypothetical protein
MNLESTWQHVAAATELLAGSGSVKDRLYAAYHNELSQLDIDALPGELRPEYRRWHDCLHRVRPLRGENAVRATLNRLSGAEADRLAQTFVKLSLRLMRMAPNENMATPEARANGNPVAAVVQLFPGSSRPG